jgi:hypothetical protein
MEAGKHPESYIRELMANIRQEHMDLYFGGLGPLSKEERIKDEVRRYCQSRNRLAFAWGAASDTAKRNPELVCDVLIRSLAFIQFFPSDEAHRDWQVYSLLPQELQENYDVIRVYVGQGGSFSRVSGRLLNEQNKRELTHLSEQIELITEDFAEAMTARLGRQRAVRRGRVQHWGEEAPTIRFEEVCSLDLWEKFQRPQLVLQVDISQDPPLFRTFAGNLFHPEGLPELEKQKAVTYVLPDRRTVYARDEIAALAQEEKPERKKRKGLATALRQSVGRRLKKAARRSQTNSA